MKIQINGVDKEIHQPIPLKDVVEQFCNRTSNVIAEVNGNIVPCDEWNQKEIKHGDTIELVSFVGGG